MFVGSSSLSNHVGSLDGAAAVDSSKVALTTDTPATLRIVKLNSKATAIHTGPGLTRSGQFQVIGLERSEL